MARTLLSITAFIFLCFTTLWYADFNVENWFQSVSARLNFPGIKGNAETGYQTFVFSEDPLVVYIPNFLSSEEALQLVELSTPNFVPSVLYSSTGHKNQDPNYRSSETATLPLTGPGSSILLKRISDRARSFPFYEGDGERKKEIKPLVVQKYGLGHQYKDHYDWFHDGEGIGGNIETNCTGGGTNFPRLSPTSPLSSYPFSSNPKTPNSLLSLTPDQWCQYIDCDRPLHTGVTFKPITGNAIFWRNLRDANREGHLGTLHAGLPVTSGEKMGLNIWSWEMW